MLRLVVLGDPVAHSMSPAIHSAALRAAGIEGEYTARRVDRAGLGAAVEELRRGELDGANVTMPHKGSAADLADRLQPSAARSLSVNTLVPVSGKVIGYTTDVDGVSIAWGWAGLPEDAPVLVLGAGGAAAAALVALEDRQVTLAARDPGRAAEMLDRIGIRGEVTALGVPVAGAVVVNATPLGMRGESLPVGVVEASKGLFDMAYGSGETPAVALARRLGLPVADGPDMLLAQAAASFLLWTGVEAPLQAMRAALRGAGAGDS